MQADQKNRSKPGGPPFTPWQWRMRYLYAPVSFLVYLPLVGVFTAFGGIVGLTLSVISLRPMDFIGICWGRLLCWLNSTWVSRRGLENLAPGQSYVIMCNHQSHFDILVMYGFWPRPFKWVMKEELRKVPFIGSFCARARHVFVDRRDREKSIANLNAAKAWITDGTSILFFPEGTRSRDGRMQSYKKGGFIMALDMGLPILPVSISGTYKLMPRNHLWVFPGKAVVTVHKPIDVSNHTPETRQQLMAEVRTSIRSGLPEWERGEE